MTDPFYDEPSATHFAQLEELVAKGGVTAILGGGLSRSAGMPSWAALFRRICEEAHGGSHADCDDFDPEAGIHELTGYRDEIGDGRCLEIMRGMLDEPVDVIPESYELIAETFHILVTTNYDNFLEGVALKREVSPLLQIFPGTKGDARYIYLHGQAKHATSMHDFVLCRDDYERAYAFDSPVRVTLARLLQEPTGCVFVGSSLSDPDVSQLLKHLDSMRRQFAQVGGRHQEIYQGAPGVN